MPDQRDTYKQIIRDEMIPVTGRGSVEALIGLDDINYGNTVDSDSRLTNLENNETVFQVFQYVGTATSGNVSLYEEGGVFDIYNDGVLDAIIVKADTNQNPIEEAVLDSGGDQVFVQSLTDNGDGTAAYLLTSIPVDNACIIYFIKIKDLYKGNVDTTKIIPPSFQIKSGILEKVIRVAKAGGDYNNIKEAVESITDSSGINRYTIQVAPGVYIEDNSIGPINIPSFVSIQAIGIRSVIVTPQDDTQSTFEITGTSTFNYILGVVFSGNGINSWAVEVTTSGRVGIWDCVLRDCYNGFLMDNSSGTIDIKRFAVNNPLGTTTNCVIKILAGKYSILDGTYRDSSIITTGIEVNGSTCLGKVINIDSISINVQTAFKIDGGALFNGSQLGVIGAFDGLVVDGDGTEVRLFSCVFRQCQQDGFRIQGTGSINFSLYSGVVISNGRWNFNVDNSNSIITGSGFTELDKGNIASGALFIAELVDITEGDEGLNILGELHVGRSMNPSESVFGGGDSHTFEYVYTFNGVSTYTDKTTEAKSFTGSTLQFDGITTNNAIYIANRYPITFEGIKIAIETPVNIGSGVIIAEYWNGSWVEMNACTVLSSTPFLKYSKNYFNQAGGYHIKYNPYIRNDWVVNDPVGIGENYYWMRFRITSTITSSPVIQQIKIHTSRTEINGDGTSEFHMDARVYKKLKVDALRPIEGNMQSASIYVDENVGVGLSNNRFTAVADILGVSFELPEDCDTSAPLVLNWKGKFSATGSAQFTVRLKIVRPGDPYTNTEPAPSGDTVVALTELRTISSIDTREDFRVDLDISEAIPSRSNGFGDEIWITIQNTTRSGNFDYTKISANYLSDFAGRHIRQ